MPGNFIDIEIVEKDFANALRMVEAASESVSPRYLKNVQTRHARPIVAEMKANCKSAIIEQGIGITTSKKRAGEYGIKVGVVKGNIKHDAHMNIGGLAAIIEYGTGERFRQTVKYGIITGRVSTGSMPKAPFLRPAWDANIETFMRGVEEAIIKHVKKAEEV